MTFTENSIRGIPEHYMPRCRKKKSRKRSKNKSKKWVNYPIKPKTTKPRREPARTAYEKIAQKQDHLDSLHCFETCGCADCKARRINYLDSLSEWLIESWIEEQEETKRRRDEDDEICRRRWEE